MERINLESPVVQGYLNILQNVIGRMATDSAACKTWCITLVSAIVVVVATRGTPDCVWISLMPVVLFLFLDAYYLVLERHFRKLYNDFTQDVREGTVSAEDAFVITPISSATQLVSSINAALKSVSIWPFYGMVLLTLLVTRYAILKN